MSAVTLETLRANFETAREAFIREYALLTPEDKLNGRLVDRARREVTPEAVADKPYKIGRMIWEGGKKHACYPHKLCEVGRLYLLARDYGLEAAMLYKLSDGAIDPREGGDA